MMVELARAKVSAAVRSAEGTDMRARQVRLELVHGIFHALQDVAMEMADARRLGELAESYREDGDDDSEGWTRKREELAARAAGRAVESAVVQFVAALAMSVPEGCRPEELTRGSSEEVRQELEAILAVML